MPKYQSKYKGNQIDNLLDFVNDNKDNLALKEEIPEIPSIPRNISELSNDLGFITNTVNNLINYYKKSETYTKDEINTIVSAAASGGFIKVNELPTEDINIKAIYLVPYTGSRTKNLYEEYIYTDGDWEMIGTTKIDLSNYVTITALNTALADYLTSASFNEQIANYYNKTEIAELLADKIDNNKIGAANGVASLDNNGKIPSSQLPEQQSGGASADGKAESSAIAPVFDPTATYAEGDRVMYEDELYVANTDHTGAWDADDFDKTDVDSEIPDKLTSQQMQEIKDAFVVDSPRNGYPVLFDETGAERFVGWYKYANGTKKPVYEKTVIAPLPSSYPSTGSAFLLDLMSLNIDKPISLHWIASDGATHFETAESQLWSITILYKKGYENKTGLWLWGLQNGDSWILSHSPLYVRLKYTKTTDTPQ